MIEHEDHSLQIRPVTRGQCVPNRGLTSMSLGLCMQSFIQTIAHGLTRPPTASIAFLLSILFLTVSPIEAQELSKAELFAQHKAAPTIAHVRCPGSLNESVCSGLVHEAVLSDEQSELAPNHLAPDVNDPTLQTLLEHCHLSTTSGPFGVSDEMYGPDAIFPRGPFKMFDVQFDSSGGSLARVLVVAAGYRRQGADQDLFWRGYYLITPEKPCSPTTLEFYQAGKDLQFTDAFIRLNGQLHLLTLFQQERQGDYYSGHLIEIGPDEALSNIGIAIEF